MSRVFVSHSHQDNGFCRAFIQTLHELEVETWYDEENLGPGMIHNSITEGLPTCDRFIVVLSPAAVESYWVNLEIGAAMDLERRGKLTILPVVASPCEVPLLLSSYLRVEDAPTPQEAARRAQQMLAAQPRSTASDIEVKVVTSPEDPDLDRFLEIYAQLFPLAEERATPEDMVRYIEEAQVEKGISNPDFLEELVLVKRLGRVVAFMNYTFYYSSRYVFVSYIGNVAGERASSAVIGALLAYFKQVMLDNGCLAVIFEVETKRIKPKGEIARIRRFRTYLKSYAHMTNTNCYEVDFDFVQPRLMIDEVQDTRATFRDLLARFGRSPDALADLGVAHTLALGFIPLQPNFTASDVITKEKLMSILRFVYGQVYADSFTDDKADDKKYKSYMERLIRYYERTLKKSTPLRAEGTW